ncbi:acetyl-CoA carboxylase biotin carboxyl carrier protein [Actinokineospora iranica]|uniref:Biotin carboxyl carrier protein of acetyl-CoA carboxylase n=1 Tax=Actinokineospora iranica TaxID=1271860 RepID=A0A1G6U1E2_9PSEU|nr:biotin/lipoyl-containing protein [Actinokineospora iranica]SDD34427.1 acetyl-CoA carboxylase biotin carboxyl carrier protein [Actinokineospora iranica]
MNATANGGVAVSVPARDTRADLTDQTVHAAQADTGQVDHIGQVDQVVTVLREQALATYANASHAPTVVRVSAHDVAVEVRWTAEARPAEPRQTESWATDSRAVDSRAVDSRTAGSRAPESRAPQSPEPGAAADDTAGRFPLCANTVGVFYRAPEPGAAPFVVEGDVIAPGQQVAIVEAMKLMIPVEADRAGLVVEFLVPDGAPVEHGQPVLLLEPAR